MKNFSGYKCSLCGTEYLPGQVTYTCPKDGGNLDVILDTDVLKKKFQPQDITSRTEFSLWRYLPLLPVDEPEGDSTPLHAAGWTPVFALPRSAEKLNLKHLWLKDESRNPTASFKDRASAVVVTRAREIKADVVVTASTGNAGAALAGMAAAIGQKAVIFAPKSAPQAKVAQLLIFGAKVILVDGTYDNAFDLSIKASDEFGWYCRNTGYNPFTLEGKKTAAFEIWEWWLNAHRDWHSKDSPLDDHRPLTIFVSVGDGNIISGIHKGFKDLLALGWIPNVPHIIGVQAEGSAAISNAFHANTEVIKPVSAKTIADSISVNLPRDGVRALRAAKETDGTYLTVSDEEIVRSIAELGKMGIFAEPAGAAAYAGLVKATSLGVVGGDDPVLVLNTGSGLKDVRAAMQAVVEAPIIAPTLEALKKILMKTPWDIPFRYIVLIFLVIIVVVTLWYIRDVFKPLISAGLLAYFLSPAVSFLTSRARIRRKVAANIVYFVTLAILVALPFTILPTVFDEFQGIVSDLNHALDQLQGVLAVPQRIGIVNVYLGGLIPAIRENLTGDIVPKPEDALRVLAITSRNFLWLLVILVTAYYLMTDWDRLKSWLISLAPEDERSDMTQLYNEIRNVWSSYLGGQIRLIVILALIYSATWSVIGLPGAVALGILAGLLNLIPEVGPAGAAILATTVALLEGSNFLPMSNIFFAILTLGVYLLVNTFKTVWLQPRILGHSVFLHEGLVFVAIVTAIILLGVLGVLIVVPLMATLVVLGRYLRRRLLGLNPFEKDDFPSSDSKSPLKT